MGPVVELIWTLRVLYRTNSRRSNGTFPECESGTNGSDTTRGKYSYDRIIQKFEQKEIDILVGTQMLTKGLDFRDVKLVEYSMLTNLLISRF